MWPHTSSIEQSVGGLNADGGGIFHRSWLDMDRVDPCQPTQSSNVGAATMQGGKYIGAEHIVVGCS